MEDTRPHIPASANTALSADNTGSTGGGGKAARDKFGAAVPPALASQQELSPGISSSIDKVTLTLTAYVTCIYQKIFCKTKVKQKNL